MFLFLCLIYICCRNWSITFHRPANPLYTILLLSNPLSTPVTTHLKFSILAIYMHHWTVSLDRFTAWAPHFSVLSPSLKITHRHPLAPLSVTPQVSTHNWSVISYRAYTLTHLILCISTLLLNCTRLNRYTLTLRQSAEALPWPILWTTPLIWRSAREHAVAKRLPFEWHFISLEITITII